MICSLCERERAEYLGKRHSYIAEIVREYTGGGVCNPCVRGLHQVKGVDNSILRKLFKVFSLKFSPKEKKRLSMLRVKIYRDTPEYKAMMKAFALAYNKTPEAKAKKKAYRETPEAKAKAKARVKIHRETPEYKARKKVLAEKLKLRRQRIKDEKANNENTERNVI